MANALLVPGELLRVVTRLCGHRTHPAYVQERGGQRASRADRLQSRFVTVQILQKSIRFLDQLFRWHATLVIGIQSLNFVSRFLEVLRFHILHSSKSDITKDGDDGRVRIGHSRKVLFEEEQLLQQLVVGVVEPVRCQKHVPFWQEGQRFEGLTKALVDVQKEMVVLEDVEHYPLNFGVVVERLLHIGEDDLAQKLSHVELFNSQEPTEHL